MTIKGSKKGWSAKRFQGAKTKVDRIHDFKEEMLRFACMRTQKKRSGAVVQTKRSFSSPPNPHLDRAGSSGAPGGRGLLTVCTPAPSPSPPRTPIWTERARAGRRGAGGWNLGVPQPPPPLSRYDYVVRLYRPTSSRTPAPGGGGLPLPAAAAAAPEKAATIKGSKK